MTVRKGPEMTIDGMVGRWSLGGSVGTIQEQKSPVLYVEAEEFRRVIARSRSSVHVPLHHTAITQLQTPATPEPLSRSSRLFRRETGVHFTL